MTASLSRQGELQAPTGNVRIAVHRFVGEAVVHMSASSCIRGRAK